MNTSSTSDGGTALAVGGGHVRVIPGSGSAALSWPAELTVSVNGSPVEGTRCRVQPGDVVDVEMIHVPPSVDYHVHVARDRMQAALTVDRRAGIRRTLEDAEPSTELRLCVVEQPVHGDLPNTGDATVALQREQVTFGVDRDAIQRAIDEPGTQQIVAAGREPVLGTDGSVALLVDFEALRMTGVTAQTPLLDVTPKREGMSGMDVTGRELSVPAVRDVKVRLGEGVSVGESRRVVVATVDGAPEWSPEEGRICVRHELFLDNVDSISGDIAFSGSVHVSGDVKEGRRLSAGHRLFVAGNADRAHLESGDTMQVAGTVMSSVLRAGGERAVAASVVDRLEHIPSDLATANLQASELRLGATDRGTTISYGLSIQLILERMYRYVFTVLDDITRELTEAGEKYEPVATDVSTWRRRLATAAISSMTPEQYTEILAGLGALVSSYRSAVETRSDLVVGYVQSSEIEATGTITLTGKGAINSRIVAWEGLVARSPEGIVRGGSLVAHGPVEIAEIGSPGGSTMQVQLGKGASLDARLAYAGTVITSKGGSHRFIADRSHVKVRFDDLVLNVESLAA